MTYTATYSPEDNKLRLYASGRLDPATYERVRQAGFIWAPKQELWVAPMWTPAREDLCVELAGAVEDEDTSLVDRAEERAERFEEYADKRTQDATAAQASAHRIMDGIPLGQPILVGHHSERRARKDAERIETGLRNAVRMWDTATYWESRAKGALRAAKYKERPDVRARRIKGLEADERKQLKLKAHAEKFQKAWSTLDGHQKKDGTEATPLEWALFLANYDRVYGVWSGLKDGTLTPEAAQAQRLAELSTYLPVCERWIAHYRNRLTYERAMLAESGWTPPPKPKTKTDLPLLNYAGETAYRNLYNRDEVVRGVAVGITKAEWAKISPDYKGTRVSACGTHRIRTALLHTTPGHSTLETVYISDSKQHPRPSAETVQETAAAESRQREAEALAAAERRAARAEAAPLKGPPEQIQAMRDTLRQGVQVVSAPQLFPTPPNLARRMVALATIEPGQRVLEPSAGTGNLVRAVVERMGDDSDGQVVAVEVHPTLADRLDNIHPSPDVRCMDFLSCNGDLGTFDRVVMNPPFRDSVDVKHILHALTFLKPGGRLVALCANGPRQRQALRPLASTWEELPAGTFEGTGVSTVLLTIDAEATS